MVVKRTRLMSVQFMASVTPGMNYDFTMGV